MIPYQFAQLFYMHDASSGEVATVGLVMWVPSEQKFYQFVNVRYGRLSGFWADFNGNGYSAMSRFLRGHFEKIAERLDSNQLALFKPGVNASMLNQVLSHLIIDVGSCFKWSHIMSGISECPSARFEELRYELIERHEHQSPRKRVDEKDLWSRIEKGFLDKGIYRDIQSDVEISGSNYSYVFKAGWKNGIRRVIEPISFDYLDPREIIDKANTWSGRLLNLSKGTNIDFRLTAVISPSPSKLPGTVKLYDAYCRAQDILLEAPRLEKVMPQEGIGEMVDNIAMQIHH